MHTLPQPLISLIHYVELSKVGWWEETTDRCVLGILWLIKEPAPISRIRKKILDELGLDLKSGELNASLTRLIKSDQMLLLPDGRYKLSVACENSLSRQVENSRALEESVKSKFGIKILEICPKADIENLWDFF